jgi:hypothetical protein
MPKSNYRQPHGQRHHEKKETRQLGQAKKMLPLNEELAHGLRVLVIYSKGGLRTGKRAAEFADRIARSREIEADIKEKEVEPTKSGGHWLANEIEKMRPHIIFIEKRAQREGEIDLRALAASVPDAKIVELDSPDYQLIEDEMKAKMHASA